MKVLVEGGPRLDGDVYRLADLAVQHLGVHTIGAWMLYDNEEGQRTMHCVPLTFTDGAVKQGKNFFIFFQLFPSLLII